jgi:excisionase family DNA binding protein
VARGAFSEQGRAGAMNEISSVSAILAVSVPEAGRRLGVSARTVTNLIRARELPSRKIGRRRVILVAALESFLRKDHETEPTQ